MDAYPVNMCNFEYDINWIVIYKRILFSLFFWVKFKTSISKL